MSRKKTQAELDAEAEAADLAAAEKHRQQSECAHWHAEPTEWWFSTGKVREMQCCECGKTRFFEEEC